MHGRNVVRKEIHKDQTLCKPWNSSLPDMLSAHPMQGRGEVIKSTTYNWREKSKGIMVTLKLPHQTNADAQTSKEVSWQMNSDPKESASPYVPNVGMLIMKGSDGPRDRVSFREDIMLYSRMVFGSAMNFTMAECASMQSFLPVNRRKAKRLKHVHITQTDYLDRCVATPALNKSISIFYIVATEEGLWMHSMSSKTSSLLFRTANKLSSQFPELSGMLRVPVQLYAGGSFVGSRVGELTEGFSSGWLNPLVPFGFSGSDPTTASGLLYSKRSLDALADLTRKCTWDLMPGGVSVGLAWNIGEAGASAVELRDDGKHTCGPKGSYQKYLEGNADVTALAGLSSLSIVPCRDDSVEYISGDSLDSATLTVCSEGVLCDVPASDQREGMGYEVQVIRNMPNAVAYLGVRSAQFAQLVDATCMEAGKAYTALARLNRGMDSLVLTHLEEAELSSVKLKTLTEVEEQWSCVVDPVFPLLKPDGFNIPKLSWCMWSALSRGMNLEEENAKILVVTSNIMALKTLVDHIPSSWSVYWYESKLKINCKRDSANPNWPGVHKVTDAQLKNMEGLGPGLRGAMYVYLRNKHE